MIHWNYLLSLEKDIIRLSNYIEFCEENFNVFSIEILKLNLSIGSEIDVVLKQTCKLFNPIGKYESIKDYKIFLNENLDSAIKEKVSIPRYNIELQPWESIGNKKNYKYENPFWWDNYNNVKHHRDSEYNKANLKNLLYSFSALVIVNLHRMIKINNITDLSDTFEILPELEMFNLDEKYYVTILRID